MRFKKPAPISRRQRPQFEPASPGTNESESMAAAVVLPGEDRTRFLALLAGYIETFQPAGIVETDLVEEMAVCKWRQMRCWRHESEPGTRDRIDTEIAREERSAASRWNQALRVLRQLQRARVKAEAAFDGPAVEDSIQPSGPSRRPARHTDQTKSDPPRIYDMAETSASTGDLCSEEYRSGVYSSSQ